MGSRVISSAERLFFLMVWVIIALIAAGALLHLASSKGILPGVAQWIGSHTDLAAQAGA